MAWAPPSINTVRQGASSSAAFPAVNEIPQPTIGVAINAVANSYLQASFNLNNPSNPFYLHPNENLVLELVSSVLDGSNYHLWARAMRMALSSKKKLGFIDGSITIPSKNNLQFAAWDQCNNMVVSWLLCALSPTIARSVLWKDSARGIWIDLEKRFSQQDIFRITEIRAEIYRTTQGENSVNEYFSQLKLLWDELMVLRPPLVCECDTKCVCCERITNKVAANLENEMLFVFLIGLHERYTSAKNQIMLMKPLPDVTDTFSMISQQERQFQIIASNGNHHVQSSENLRGSVFFTKAEGSTGFQRRTLSGNNKKPVCTFCGYTGHTVEKCYKKHDYPPGWKPRSRNQRTANQVQVSAQQSVAAEGPTPFTQDDYKKFLEFIQMQRMSSNTPLDMGTFSSSSPQANLIAANFIPNEQVEGSTPWEDDWLG